jgi:hypothetical protein
LPHRSIRRSTPATERNGKISRRDFAERLAGESLEIFGAICWRLAGQICSRLAVNNFAERSVDKIRAGETLNWALFLGSRENWENGRLRGRRFDAILETIRRCFPPFISDPATACRRRRAPLICSKQHSLVTIHNKIAAK